jgi:hypothetical protein
MALVLVGTDDAGIEWHVGVVDDALLQPKIFGVDPTVVSPAAISQLEAPLPNIYLHENLNTGR